MTYFLWQIMAPNSWIFSQADFFYKLMLFLWRLLTFLYFYDFFIPNYGTKFLDFYIIMLYWSGQTYNVQCRVINNLYKILTIVVFFLSSLGLSNYVLMTSTENDQYWRKKRWCIFSLLRVFNLHSKSLAFKK